MRRKGGGPEATGHVSAPAHLTSFVGRVDELIELRRLLRTTRLLTLTGPAGVGKTRLAVELADQERRSNRCDVAVVGLLDVLEPAAIAARIAQALAIPDVREEPAQPRPASDTRDRLLVLNDCEHVLDACAPVLTVLLTRFPALRVVATSREAFRAPGEIVFPVQGLSTPDPQGDGPATADLRSYAVRLFVDRARAVDLTFELTEENAAHVTAICARLDGLPLAIELAVGLIRSFPPAEIHARLDDRFSLLTTGWRTADKRHASMRTALDWGHALLDPRQQALFRRLSVLSGRFSPEAATAVAAGPDLPAAAVPELLVSLEAKSLLVSCADREGRARFRMLESIRAYAGEVLVSCREADAFRERLVDRLVGLAAPLGDAAIVPAATLSALVEERDNLTTALSLLGDRADERRLLLSAALASSDPNGDGQGDVHRLLDEALEQVGARSGHRAVAAEAAAMLAAARDDQDTALRLAGEAIRTERDSDTRYPLLSRLLLRRAALLARSGELTRALADLQESVEISQVQGDAVMAGAALSAVSRALLQIGDVPQAVDALAKAGPDLDGSGAPAWVQAHLHGTAGMIALERGDIGTAQAAFRKMSEYGDERCGEPSLAIEGLAVVAIGSGRYEAGLHLIAVARTLGAPDVSPWWRGRVDGAVARAFRELPAARARTALASGRRVPRHLARARACEILRSLPADAVAAGPVDCYETLSRREWEVVSLVVKGLTNRQIAARLFLSVRTVETHLSHIRTHLGLRSRSHLAAWGAKHRPCADPATSSQIPA